MSEGILATLRPVDDGDGPDVLAILNHYISNSFAAYPEQEHPPETFGLLAQMVLPGSFWAVVANGQLAGFAFLSPFLHAATLARTAQVTYFIAPEHTGKGLGVLLLDKLTELARHAGVDNLLAHISSLNDGSIRFHRRNGFETCGEFKNVGRKNGKDFGVIYMQKFI